MTDWDNLGGRFFGKYIYSFTDKNNVSQPVGYIPDFRDLTNDFVNSETAVVSGLKGYLSLKASYVVK